MALGLFPAAGEHMVLAIRRLDDFPVPVIPLLHGDIFQAILGIARSHGRRAPDIRGQGTDDRRRQKIINEGLGGFWLLPKAGASERQTGQSGHNSV